VANPILQTDIKADNSQFKKAVSEAEQVVSGMSKKSVAAIAAVGVAFTAASAAAFALINTIASNIDKIDKIYDSSRKLTISVKAFQELNFAAERANVSMGSVEQAVTKLSAKLGKLYSEGKSSVLGMDLKSLVNLSPDQQFIKIAQGLESITNSTQRAYEANQLFGRNYKEVLGIISDGLTNNINLANKMGLILSESDVALVHAAAEARGLLSDSFAAFIDHLTVGLAPAFKDMADFMLDSIERFGGMAKAAEAFGWALKAALAPVVVIAKGLMLTLEGIIRAKNFIQKSDSIDLLAGRSIAGAASGIATLGADMLSNSSVSGFNQGGSANSANFSVNISKEFFKSAIVESGNSLKSFAKEADRVAKVFEKMANAASNSGGKAGEDVFEAYAKKQQEIYALLNQGGEGYLAQAVAGKQLPQLQSEYFNEEARRLLEDAQSGRLSQEQIKASLNSLQNESNSQLALNGYGFTDRNTFEQTGTNTGMNKAIEELRKLLVDKEQQTIKVDVSLDVAPNENFDIKAEAKARMVVGKMFEEEARKVAR